MKKERSGHEIGRAMRLRAAKLNLYRELLNKDKRDLTDTEINLLHELDHDTEVQEIIEEFGR